MKMSVENVYNNRIVQDYFTDLTSRNTDGLGKDDFLNLLVTQLKYQDPLKPMEDKEFIAQMAQFSALEQMQNMNQTFNDVKAFSMIGKAVAALIQDEKEELKEVVGVVESVRIANGRTYAQVDGRDIAISDITDVFEIPPKRETQNITEYTGMVGKNVTAIFLDGENGHKVDINGDVKEISLIEDTVYTKMDNVEAWLHDVKIEADEVFTDMETYLSDNMDKEVTLVIREKALAEDETIPNVTVKGILRNVEMDETSQLMKVSLDGVQVPANNILSIR